MSISLIKNGKSFAAKLSKIDFKIDVAIVKTYESDIGASVLNFKPSSDVLIGTRVFTVGSPSGFENNVTEGILSSRDRTVFKHTGAPKYLFTDAHVLPGNSGGALISETDGKVIGMMALIVSGIGLYGLNAAIPSEYLMDFAGE
jgi:serine protease DegS